MVPLFARCALVILLTGVGAPVLCQEAKTAATSRETFEPLRKALVDAWQQHPAAREAEAKLEAARARAHAAGRPLYNPELELASDHEGEDRLRTVGISQTLDLSGKRLARRALGDAELALAEAEYTLQRSEFARDWLGAWSRVLAMARQVEFGEKRVAFANRLAELAERQVAVGDISGPERDLVLLARDEAVAEQATLLADAASAREAFAKVGGTSAALVPPLPSHPPPAAPADVGFKITDLPEWQVAAAEAEGAQRRVTVAERDRRPDPTLSLRGGRINTGPVSDNIVGVSVSVPLFVRNSFRAEADAARADADSADAALQRQRLELQARAGNATETYIATREAWMRWHRSRGTDLSTRSNVLERLWTAGELSTSDYVLQLKQTLDTALAGAALEGRVWQSYFDYLYAVGQLDDWTNTGHGP